ncbi:MAG TPA: FAD binding domain-containing protein [Burkholderiales bacterium]|nr:FAD binding domain-containing protein [Burkholderiales bacterium]
MKAAAFDYARAGSITAAVDLLSASEGRAKVIAGGQSLGPMLNLRLAQPALLVDIRHIRELNEIRQTEEGCIVGSCVTHAAVEDGEVPDFTRGFMKKVAAGIAYRAVRNRGTIGGSVCHADPAGDWVVALTLLSAVALIEGPGGRSEMSLQEFVTGPFSTQLDPAQILVGMRIPRLAAQARWSYYKFCRKPGEFADAIGAILHDGSGACRAVIGATSGAPRVIEDARFLVERSDPGRMGSALEAAGVAHDPYEMQIHSVVLKRAAAQLAA